MGLKLKDSPPVTLSPLKIIKSPEGSVLHHLNQHSPAFCGYGESYLSTINAHCVKAWKLHQSTTQNICVPLGRALFVIYDARISSSNHKQIQEYILDSSTNYSLLTIPPGIWYGFQSLTSTQTIVLNVIDRPYSPPECIRKDKADPDIPYTWQ